VRVSQPQPQSKAIAVQAQRASNRYYGIITWSLIMALAVMSVMASTMTARSQSMPGSFADLVDQVGDAVVNITTSSIVAGRTIDPQPMVPDGSPLEDFFNDFMERNNRPDQAPRRSQALGSGFVISEDGYIVTNNHVIAGADEILIEFRSGQELPAEVIGTDPNTDIAVLKVSPDAALPFVPFGDSNVMRVGDWVMAVGNPLGQGFSVSVGIVSARERALSGTYDDFIQTDAAINRGNSGGPLFNTNGEVVGVNTAILSPNGGSIGIGFAMSSDVVIGVVDQLREFGETRRGWLGVRIQDVTPDIAEGLGLSLVRGALVTDVPEGPALEAGVTVGDVILSFDGQDVEDTRGLVRTVGNAPVGETVRMLVFREGETQTLLVTLGRRETAESASAPVLPEAVPEAASADVLGVTVTPLTEELRSELDLGANVDGLVVQAVDETADAFAKGLRAGDLITEVGQEPVTDVAAFETRISEARDAGQRSILMLIRRGADPRFIALALN
jgi:serine protease Do